MISTKKLNTQCLETTDGESTFVVLPIQEFEALKNDYNDLKIVNTIRDGERNPDVKLYKALKKAGIITEYTDNCMDNLISIFLECLFHDVKIEDFTPNTDLESLYFYFTDSRYDLTWKEMVTGDFLGYLEDSCVIDEIKDLDPQNTLVYEKEELEDQINEFVGQWCRNIQVEFKKRVDLLLNQ